MENIILWIGSSKENSKLRCLICVLVFIATTISSCSREPELPGGFGLYVRNSNKYIEVSESYSFPFKAEDTDLIIDNSNPEFVLASDIESAQNITLSKDGGTSPVKIEISSNGDNAFGIKPTSSLSNGGYCIIIGDESLPLRNLQHWCFTVGNAKTISFEATQAVTNINKYKNIQVPGDGIYLAYEDKSTKEITSTNLGNKVVYTDGLISTSSKKPVALFQSATLDPQDWRLYKLNYALGNVITSETPCGFDGYTIISVEGLEAKSCEAVNKILEGKVPNSTVAVELSKGSRKTKEMLPLSIGIFYTRSRVSTNLDWGDNFAIIYPNEDLVPGIYCYNYVQHYQQQGNFYCFTIIY